MAKTMHLNVFTQASPSPQFKGMWRADGDRTAVGYRSIDYWTEYARKLEAACVDALFFADVHGVYDVYQGSWVPAVRNAVQVPSIDPAPIVAAAATVTRHLGLAMTYSTTYHQPYECARLFSSLDHLTGGRVGWNIVTSYLRSATANGLGEYLEHDLRYDRATEYVDVVRALWERSWDDDAVVLDAERNVFTDPEKVREIGHDGKWFSVRGPHQCEPSPQRTPVLYQAGASPKGMAFAARVAEVAFLTLSDPEVGAGQVSGLRSQAVEHGRAPEDIKVLQGSMVMVGATTAEAKQRAAAYNSLWSAEGQLAKWCGWMDVDLAKFPDDTPVDDVRGQASNSFLGFLKRLSPDREWTIGDVKYLVSRPRRPRTTAPVTLYGTPEQVADRMTQWLEVADVDGFNLIPCLPSAGVDDICDLLVPELQRRGMFRRAYDPAERTLRERYFGAGNVRCRAHSPGSAVSSAAPKAE
ncbi:LLM class flavin-dependent oxidoreductase [Amycolatopsis sp. CA-230715]|uniref:LLM class flavin-dependent oxidoreductase n=1 Tax=Amycolatopsis sp. CA-230715 TaxID=2745196 RepID=UPI001C32C85C|nr:LLM class flavin-dependent oxidoreductase [Amycolatopsis sp. CA-230715]QWF84784.1 Dimethyl-sulfide monooxygenase [Amycolatopsis sp. CA-230715]